MIMAVQPESLEVLEKANLPAVQARAIVRAIEIEIAGAGDQLATKSDLVVLRHELREEIGETRRQLRHEMSELRAELKTGISELRAEFKKDISDLRAELKQDISDLRAEMHSLISGLARQFYLAILGQTAVMLGFFYFMADKLR
jgi:hypothetical protein